MHVQTQADDGCAAVDLALRSCVLGSNTRVVRRPGVFGAVEGPGRPAYICRMPSAPKSWSHSSEPAAVANAVEHGYMVVGIAPDPATCLPRVVAGPPDIAIVLDALHPDDLPAVVHAVFGRRVTRTTLAGLETASVAALASALRPARGLDRSLARLRRIVEHEQRRTVSDRTLDHLPGLGRAGREVREIANDLRAVVRGAIPVTDLLRGLLLVGPPGTGKTSIATAIAATAGVPIIVGGLGKWQSAGEAHLGTTLKDMRTDFAEATKLAPSILLIDEIDGFGDRRTFSDHHRVYSSQVLNGLLEQLDGAQRRHGVLVVATTNHPEHIDPAIVRAGRFDRTIRIDLPDAEGLAEILMHYASDLTLAQAQRLAAALPGASGADVEGLVRHARGRARRAGRALLVTDIEEALRPDLPNRPEDHFRRTSVHEAGHVLAAILLGMPTPRCVRLSPDGGDTVIGDTVLSVKADIEAYVAFLLSGRAAEGLLLEEPGPGAGGSNTSDLARAIELILGLHASYGLGNRLMHLGQPGTLSDVVRMQMAPIVESSLQDSYAEAGNLLRPHLDILNALSEALLDQGWLDSKQIEIIATGVTIERKNSVATDAR